MASTSMVKCLGSRAVAPARFPAARRNTVIVRAEPPSLPEPQQVVESAKNSLLEAQSAVNEASVSKPMGVPGLPSSWKQAVPNGGESPTTITKPGGYGIGEAMSFSGPAPEIINGRLAMLGFAAAVGAELFSGKPLATQFSQTPGPVIAISIVFACASLIPMIRGANLKEESGPFTKMAELWNGRAAMLGFAALLFTEAVKGGHALF